MKCRAPVRGPGLAGWALLLGLALLPCGQARAQVAGAASAPEAASAPAVAADAAAPAASVVNFAPIVAIEPAPQRRVNAAWFDQPLGTDPPAWRYSAALDALGAGGQADALRRVLLRRHLTLLAGETPNPALTVRQALAEGETLKAPDADPDLRGRWAELINQHLRAVVPAAALPLPPELEADAARLREAAPGLWSLHAPDGSLRGRVWWLRLRNQAALPLALAEFRVRAPAGPVNTVFDCSLPRYAEMALALPGRDTAYLCRANAGAGPARAWDDLARLLRSSTSLPLRLEPIDLASATPVQRVALRLEAPHKDAAAALVLAVPAAEASAQTAARGLPAKASAVAASASASANAAAATPRAWADKLRIGGLIAAAIAIYSFMAWMAGHRAAMLITWGLSTAGALVAVFKGIPGVWTALPKADTWAASGGALAPMLTVLAALVVPAFAATLLAVCYELLFGERFGVLRALGRGAAGALVDGVVERLFGGRRGS